MSLFSNPTNRFVRVEPGPEVSTFDECRKTFVRSYASTLLKAGDVSRNLLTTLWERETDTSCCHHLGLFEFHGSCRVGSAFLWGNSCGSGRRRHVPPILRSLPTSLGWQAKIRRTSPLRRKSALGWEIPNETSQMSTAELHDHVHARRHHRPK